MSDKSHDAEPEEELAVGELDADDALVDDPEALEAAEDALAESDDETIEHLEELLADEAEESAEAAKPAKKPIARKTAKAPVKKDAPTRKRSESERDPEADPYRAGNPVRFAKQSADELRKVVWPTWPQLVTMFFAVLVFVLIIIIIVGLLDLGFGSLLLWLFGR